MIETVPTFLAAAITAIAVENAVFVRALGLDKSVLFLKSPRMGILYGGIFTWMIMISSIGCAAFNAILIDSPYRRYLRAPAIWLCVGIVYVATYLLLKRYMPSAMFDSVRRILPITTFNTALFGALFLSVTQGSDFFKITGYALGTGIGYTIAILVIYYARKRLAICPVPRAFRGLPILLLYIGLISLAIYGLIGHSLPM